MLLVGLRRMCCLAGLQGHARRAVRRGILGDADDAGRASSGAGASRVAKKAAWGRRAERHAGNAGPSRGAMSAPSFAGRLVGSLGEGSEATTTAPGLQVRRSGRPVGDRYDRARRDIAAAAPKTSHRFGGRTDDRRSSSRDSARVRSTSRVCRRPSSTKKALCLGRGAGHGPSPPSAAVASSSSEALARGEPVRIDDHLLEVQRHPEAALGSRPGRACRRYTSPGFRARCGMTLGVMVP